MSTRFDRAVLRCMALASLMIAACAADSPGGRSASTATVNAPSGTAGSAAQNAAFGSAGSPPQVQGASGSGGGASMTAVRGGGSGGTSGAAASSAGAGAAGTPAPAGSGGMTGGTGAVPTVIVSPDQMLPPVDDYSKPGPFAGTTETDNTGPGGTYTLYVPNLEAVPGFKFIPATWGNGIGTTPQTYWWFDGVTSHGFVMIASNSSGVTSDDMTQGLDWLIEQNDVDGPLKGKLDTSRAVCVGYSLGGAGAVGCGAHPKVIATVSMHPAGGSPLGLHGPLLLFSGLNDTVCVPESFVQPIFDASPVPTFYGMLSDADHLEPTPIGGNRETAPTAAWLRLWVFGDEGAKPMFYGPDCKLCQAPWTQPQSKMLQP